VRAARATRIVRSLVFGLVLIGNCAAGAQPPEPEGYRMEDYRAPVPATVAGGVVIDTTAAHELWASGNAVWIDVLPASRRPSTLPPSALWMPLPRRDIPGSLWLPDIGRGALSPELEAYFGDHLEAATKGRRDTPVVFYCLADCWMSWNAAKRAASWGYAKIYWYRDGTDGWEAAKLPVAETEPVPGP
jgi:PQQ-dependent catabolism-associated CXXCW motif protein